MRARERERLERRQAKEADQRLSELAGQLLTTIETFTEDWTPEEKERLRAARRRLTNSNCWWVTYHAAPFVDEIIANDLRWTTQAFQRLLAAVCPGQDQ